jgi:hypothetical protein
MYGYHPPFITSPLKRTIKVQEVEEHIRHQQYVLKLLKENLVISQNRMKQQAYQYRSEREFEMRDWIFMRIQPYKHISLKQQKKENKLESKYYGLYKVLQMIGSMDYKLQFPPCSCVHSVFHVSFLNMVIINNILVQNILLEINKEWKIIL